MRERESAIPQSTRDGDASAQPSAVTRSDGRVHGRRGPGKAAVNSAAFVQLQQLQALMAQHSVDLSSQPMEVAGGRADLTRAACGEGRSGMQVTDPRQIETVVAVLIKHGLLPVARPSARHEPHRSRHRHRRQDRRLEAHRVGHE